MEFKVKDNDGNYSRYFYLKRVFAKNERGYRFNARKSAFYRY